MMYQLLRIGMFLYKWLWCSWRHKERCYPEVWKVDSKYWHCHVCHPCNEIWDIYGTPLNWKQRVIRRHLDRKATKSIDKVVSKIADKIGD